MKILIIFCLLIFLFPVSLLAGLLTVKTIKLINENIKLKDYIKLAIGKIEQARYGNFQIKLEGEDELELYKSLNSLFESITDRDLVINEYREKEKENYNLKEEFIAALTHDLKVPIIAQDKTFGFFLSGKFGMLDSVQKDVIEKLKESNSDLMAMVNSILETYKIENTGVRLEIQRGVKVKEFLINCVAGLKNIAESNGKKFYFDLPEKDFCADFDPFLIKRAVNNLIVNAINHGKATEKIIIRLNKTQAHFEIDVTDFGDGIDENEIEKIFNKYYSITNKANRVSTGLGLYLSNKIIKKHNGKIEVESKKNRGSTFKIVLPLNQEAAIS